MEYPPKNIFVNWFLQKTKHFSYCNFENNSIPSNWDENPDGINDIKVYGKKQNTKIKSKTQRQFICCQKCELSLYLW